MHRGYTKHWRKKWDKGYHHDSLLWLMMDYFIDFAAYKNKEIFKKSVGKIPLRRGQWFFTYRGLAKFLRVNPRQIRSRISMLANTGFLTLQPTHQYTIVNINNYDIYQPEELLTDTPNDTEATQGRHTSDTPLIITKKVNKDNKEKENIYPDWLDLDLWKKFRKHRVELKARMTDEAERRNINKLARLMDECRCGQDEIVGQSIERGWKGLFPIKEERPIDGYQHLREKYAKDGKLVQKTS